MKNIIKNLTAVALIAFITLSFTTVENESKEIKKSKVIWKAYKVTGSHEGTVDLKSGSLIFKDEKLSGGEFTINMGTLVSTDLSGEYKGKLENHLKSDDFFGVEKNPTASLVIDKAKATGKNSYKVSASLTIKGKTDNITFDLSIYGNKANATLKIDRTIYDVRYGSTAFFDDLKDKAIYDEFDLVVDLEF